MASSFVVTGAGDKSHHQHHSLHHQVSPKNSFKKTGFASPPPPTPSCGHGHQHTGGTLPKCVCAPATHAGSFKCRLHRVNSHGHSHSAPSAPAPVASASSTRTVEAQ